MPRQSELQGRRGSNLPEPRQGGEWGVRTKLSPAISCPVELLHWGTELCATALLRHAGALPEELGLKIVQRLAEDGESVLRGCYVGSDDLPENLSWQAWKGFRKIKLYSQTSYDHSKRVLSPENQISANQGGALLSMLERRRRTKDDSRPSPVKLSEVKSLSQLRDKAMQLNNQRKVAERELASRIAAESGVPDSSASQTVVDEQKKAALDRFSLEAADAVKQLENPSKRKRRKQAGSEAGISTRGGKSKNGEDDDKDKEMELEKDKEEQEDTITAALAHDPPMLRVALFLRALPSMKGEPEESMLVKRVTLIESIQDLVQAKDLRRMDSMDRMKRYKLLQDNDVVPSEALKIFVVRVAAEDHARRMCEDRTEADLDLFLSIVTPFKVDEPGGWDFLPSDLGKHHR